jgi:hypothetical protein
LVEMVKLAEVEWVVDLELFVEVWQELQSKESVK